MVEDSEDDMLLALQELKRGDFHPECERVETLSALTAALDHQGWDLILCDHSLQGFTSFHALELLKRRDDDIPFIILSGMIGEDVAVQAMKAGANDYVMKNALARLVPSVEREMREAANRRLGRQAEKALRRSQYELNDFFDNAPIGLHWAGPDGAILRVNAAELKMLGYEPPEYLGHNLMEFFLYPDAAKVLLQELRDGKVIEDHETQLCGKNGAVKDVALNANALWDNGNFIRSRWFVRDITARKQEEAERLLLIEDLSRSLANVKTLRGLLPICATCKKIRDDRGYWNQLESYISEHTQAEFTHGICPECQSLIESQPKPRLALEH